MARVAIGLRQRSSQIERATRMGFGFNEGTCRERDGGERRRTACKRPRTSPRLRNACPMSLARWRRAWDWTATERWRQRHAGSGVDFPAVLRRRHRRQGVAKRQDGCLADAAAKHETGLGEALFRILELVGRHGRKSLQQLDRRLPSQYRRELCERTCGSERVEPRRQQLSHRPWETIGRGRVIGQRAHEFLDKQRHSVRAGYDVVETVPLAAPARERPPDWRPILPPTERGSGVNTRRNTCGRSGQGIDVIAAVSDDKKQPRGLCPISECSQEPIGRWI